MRFIFALAVSAIMGLASAQAQVRERIRIGTWELTANYQNGVFGNCSITAPYGNRANVTFMVTGKGAFGVGVRNLDWNLNAGNRANVSYWIDGGPRRQRLATAASDKLLLVLLDENSATVFQELRLGNVMRLDTGSNTYTLTLKGTKSALDELARCYARHR
jgi:hypothetical protein